MEGPFAQSERTVGPKSSTPIDNELDRLGGTIDVLEDKFNHLLSRMSPVRMQGEYPSSPTGEPEVVLAPLGEAVRSFRKRVAVLCDAIEIVTNELQI